MKMFHFLFLFFFFFKFSRSEVAIVNIECENRTREGTTPALPLNILFGENYEVTARSTDILHGNATAKFIEQNFGDTLVMKKWIRQKESAWLNRTFFFDDWYHWNNTTDRTLHNRSCSAIPKNDSAALNALGLSPQFLNATSISGESFGQLLKFLHDYKVNWNGTLYEDPMRTIGIETIGFVGCARNFSGLGSTLQIELQYAGDKTPEQPYNQAWNNPQLYTLNLLFYEIVNGSNVTVYDHFSSDFVTLDKVDVDKREFVITPPRGLYCQGVPKSGLPLEFSDRFSSHLRTVHFNKNGYERTEYGKVIYDSVNKVVSMLTSTPDEFVVHDFVYGFQYELDMANLGTCRPTKAIDPHLHDVALTTNGTLSLRSASDLIVWMGKLNAGESHPPEFYYSGKVLGSGGEPLDSYVAQYTKQEKGNNVSLLVEVLLNSKSNGTAKAHQLHSVIHYGKDARMSVEFGGLGQRLLNSWQVLTGQFRTCINATTADTGGGYFLRLGNVSLADLTPRVGLEWVRAAVAQALSNYAGISLMRIVDLNIEQSSKDGLFAFFAFGSPSGIKPAQTIYLKKEISIQEAVQNLNSSVASKKFLIDIPLGDASKNDNLTIIVDQFGDRASLAPPCPTPAPPSPPEFVGFSGSTLAIVAVFCFIFGVGLAVAGYFFHQKRQYIRGMAYQVFE